MDDIAPSKNQQPLFSIRSERVVRQPERYISLGESVDNLPDDINPYTFKDAIKDVDVSHWQKAMKSEIESMYSNQVWTLVNLSDGIKPIG